MDIRQHWLWFIEKINSLIRQGKWSAFAFFILGLAVSVWLWQQEVRSIKAAAASQFEGYGEHLVYEFEHKISSCEQLLRAGRALLSAEPDTSRAAFQTYIGGIDDGNNHSQMQEVGYSVLVSPSEKAEHEQRTRSKGFPDYRIWPAGERDLYSAVALLRPDNPRSKRTFGYDLYADEILREAMDAARDTGKPVASRRVRKTQDTSTEEQSSFVLFLPLFKNGTAQDSVEERRQSIIGYIYSPIPASDFFASILDADPVNARKYIDFNVYDEPARVRQNLIFSSSKGLTADADSDYELVNVRTLYGRQWSFHFRSTKAFDDGIDYSSSRTLLLTSLFLTTLFSLIIAAVSARQRQLAESNEHMSFLTRELSHRGKNTLALVQALASFSFSKDKPNADGRDAFIKRLHALERAQTQLIRSSWQNASLIELVSQELEPFGRRVQIGGPEVKLNSNATQTFALILHELVTNATKYGSLSSQSGGVSIHWDIVELKNVQHLKFTWKEYGGPPVAKPQQFGFGRTVLSQPIGHGGQQPIIMYEIDGLRFEVETPLAAIQDVANNDGLPNLEELRRSA